MKKKLEELSKDELIKIIEGQPLTLSTTSVRGFAIFFGFPALFGLIFSMAWMSSNLHFGSGPYAYSSTVFTAIGSAIYCTFLLTFSIAYSTNQRLMALTELLRKSNVIADGTP